jgi:Bax protein
MMRAISFIIGLLMPYVNFASSNFSMSQQQFIKKFEPEIVIVNKTILQDRQTVLEDIALVKAKKSLTALAKKKIHQLGVSYQVSLCDSKGFLVQRCLKELSKRVDILPIDLILAQAINESNWGQSRFAIEGNNYFGIACYTQGCGIIPKNRAKDATFEVRRFDSAQASIQAYYNILNTHSPYEDLRRMRANMRAANLPLNADSLATGLESYSTEKEAYVASIRRAIAHLQAFGMDKKAMHSKDDMA